jgi:hypothetical protein
LKDDGDRVAALEDPETCVDQGLPFRRRFSRETVRIERLGHAYLA